jgi:hypothetical protein
MRTALVMAAAVAAVGLTAGTASTQVGFYRGFNPWTGRAYSTTFARNPWTGATAVRKNVYNPWTGMGATRVAGFNPWTGAAFRGGAAYNPWTGRVGGFRTVRRW